MIDERCGLKTALYKSRFVIIAIALAAISYKITLDMLKKFGIAESMYNNQMTPFAEMPERILRAIEISFKRLFAYNADFMPMSMSIIFCVFVAVLFAILLHIKIAKKDKFIITILLMVMIVASQTHIILANSIATALYVEYCGLLFLRVVIVVFVFKLSLHLIRTQALLQSLAFALSCVFIWISVVQDLQIQKIQKLTMERDFRFLNRLISRIEQSEGFSYNKQYCGIVFGSVETPNDFLGLNLFFLGMGGAFRYTMQKDVFKNCQIYSDKDYESKTQTKDFQSLISRLHKAGILDTLEPFPHKNSVVVFEDIIVFVASKGNLDEIRAKAKDL